MKRFIKYISSRRFFVMLIFLNISAYLYFTFDEKPFDKWMHFLFHSPAGPAFYTGLIVNLAAISVRNILEKLKDDEITPSTILKMDAYAEIPLSGADSFNGIIAWINKKGFAAYAGSGAWGSKKGSLSFLPGTVLRAGIITIMTALLLSAYTRKTDEKIFHDGEEKELIGRKVRASDISSGIPAEFIETGEKSFFSIGKASAALSYGADKKIISSKMPVRMDGLYCRISHLGYRQPVLFQDITLDADIDLLPPGKTDMVRIDPDAVLAFTLKPEKTIRKGTATGKVFNLRNPTYDIVLQKGNKPGKITLKPSGSGIIGNSAISLRENSAFVRIQSVYDPALFWIYAGIIITLAGIALMFSRFFWYEKKISAVFTNEKALLGYSEEYYKKWGVMKFYSWLEELKQD